MIEWDREDAKIAQIAELEAEGRELGRRAAETADAAQRARLLRRAADKWGAVHVAEGVRDRGRRHG